MEWLSVRGRVSPCRPFLLLRPLLNCSQPRPTKPALQQGTRHRTFPLNSKSPTTRAQTPKQRQPCCSPGPHSNGRCTQQIRPSRPSRSMRPHLNLQTSLLHLEGSPALVRRSRRRFLKAGGLSPGTRMPHIYPRPPSLRCPKATRATAPASQATLETAGFLPQIL